MRSSVGSLADGTPYFAPIGRMLADGDRVCCHLCGRWFLSVASHLRVHGWAKSDYIAAFGLEYGNPLTGETTRKRRAAAFVARRAVEPALQQAQIAAMARSDSGALTAAARAAARGRPHPAERRAKTLATLAAIGRDARADGSREWAARRREHIAAEAARRFGFDGFAAYLRQRLAEGLSLAAVSREAGLHKDWLCRQLAAIAPELVELAERHRAVRPHPSHVRLRPAAQRHGFCDVESYLRTRHLVEHRSLASLSHEAGVSRATVEAALRQCGVQPVPHAAKRHQAAHRNAEVAQRLGFSSLVDYVRTRRAAGATWPAMVAESGVAETTLRRQGHRPSR